MTSSGKPSTADEAAAPSPAPEIPAKLPNRIEGFGNGPPPPPLPESTADVLWSAVAESWSGTNVEGTVSGWLTSASETVENMVTAFDEAVDGLADALDEVVGGMLEDEEEWGDMQRNCPAGHPMEEKSGAAVAYLSTRLCDACRAPIPRGHPRWCCTTCNYDMCRMCHRGQVPGAAVAGATAAGLTAAVQRPATPDVTTAAGRIRIRAHRDSRQRSGVDWVSEVSQICQSGAIDQFVARVRNRCANACEQGEVGRHLADQLLNEVEPDVIHRVLYVIQGVLHAELKAARDEIEVRCKVKLQRLQATPRFKSLATELVEVLQLQTAAAPSSSLTASGTASPPAATVDLLDMEAPVAEPAQQNNLDTPDLLDLSDGLAETPSVVKDADPLFDLDPVISHSKETVTADLDIDLGATTQKTQPAGNDLLDLDLSSDPCASMPVKEAIDLGDLLGFDAPATDVRASQPAENWAKFGEAALQPAQGQGWAAFDDNVMSYQNMPQAAAGSSAKPLDSADPFL